MAKENIINALSDGVVTMKNKSFVSITVFALLLTVYDVNAGTYTTDFPLTENPISEGGRWINGKTVGIDWANVSTTPGLAIGRQSSSIKYDDATALLTGTWGPDQSVTATVHTVNQNSNVFEEVELRLRSSLSANKCTGYEVLFSCRNDEKSYVQIVRWDGPLGNFTQLNGRGGAAVGISNGDIIKATIVGNVISAYINNVLVLQATDSTYKTGSPGMGFYLEGAIGLNSDYGFTRFTASDGGIAAPKNPYPPTNLRVLP